MIAAVRRRLKTATERTLASRLAPVARRRMRGRVLVLTYHNIVPPGAETGGDASLHLPFSAFVDQLEALTATHDVLSLEEGLRPGAAGRPGAVITFDDAYRGAVTIGIAELARRGLPATVFVVPGFTGGRAFWWDALLGNAADRDRIREHALESLGGEDARVRAWAAANGVAEHPVADHARCASEAELRQAAAIPGVTLAAHTWSHPNLARLGGAALRTELEQPLQWLRERFRNPAAYLAYPYGRFTGETARAAAAAGYAAAFANAGGWLPPSAENAFALPRWNVPAGLSREGFVLRIAGLLAG